MAEGCQWEGEAAPVAGPDDLVAMRVHGLLANGMGGYDWAGLPVICAWLGVEDVAGLMTRLQAVRSYLNAKDDDAEDAKGKAK